MERTASIVEDYTRNSWPNPRRRFLADIAILDDDLDFRNYLKDFLKDEGVSCAPSLVRRIYSGEEILPDIACCGT